ncbi:uncharacterized protein G2W53_026876 [Senna tora]|uniref:Uncharacterized protein n=1 Tax=Senna tora TaxID=362788 RepID=A0A834WJ70_9FABA|nr:uncharacterized protein G2W53_026876 [Senna tora]
MGEIGSSVGGDSAMIDIPCQEIDLSSPLEYHQEPFDIKAPPWLFPKLC